MSSIPQDHWEGPDDLEAAIMNAQKRRGDLRFLISHHQQIITTLNEELNTLTSRFAHPIEALDLSVRVLNSLRNGGCETVEELLLYFLRGLDSLFAIRGVGKLGVTEIIEKAEEYKMFELLPPQCQQEFGEYLDKIFGDENA